MWLKEKNIVIFHQTLTMIPLFLVEFMMGVGIGWLAPMLHQLRESPEAMFNTENCAWIASLHYASRGVTSFAAVFMIDRLGRNIFFILSAFICLTMWIMVYSSLNVYLHYTVRIVFGVGVGFNDMAAGIYIGENCSPTLRGIFSGFYLASFYLGELVQFVLAALGVSYEWLAIVDGILGLITILSTFLLKEPAHHLIMKGNLVKAEKNYRWLHDPQSPQTEHDFENIKDYVLGERIRALNYEMVRSKEVYKSIRIVFVMHFLSYFCGYAAVNSFVTIVLSGSSGLSNTLLTIIFGIVQFLTVLLSAPFMDKFNRRTLFLGTSAILIILHTAIATLYYANTIFKIPYFYWILFALLTSFMSVHGMFIFPITTVVRGELLPQSAKAMGSSLAGISSSVGGFVGAKIFLPISESYGTHINFILFSFVSLIMFVYVYFDLPETKGKTLTDIQRELKGLRV